MPKFCALLPLHSPVTEFISFIHARACAVRSTRRYCPASATEIVFTKLAAGRVFHVTSISDQSWFTMYTSTRPAVSTLRVHSMRVPLSISSEQTHDEKVPERLK